jgi:hypothetical protein
MTGDTRAQSGLDRLMLFLIFVVAIVAITPFVFELGGVDLRADTGTDSPEATPTAGPADPGVVILGATGDTGGFSDDTVGIVRVVVTKNGSGPAVNTTSLTATWVGPDRSYALSAAGSGAGGDEQFAVNVTGLSDSETMLNQSGDRAILTFDVGTDDVDDISEFSQRLESGDTVTLALTTDSGETARVRLVVPDELAEENTVRLRTERD